MTANPSTILLPTVVFLASALNATGFAAERFHSTSYGYYLDQPPGWVEIPKDVLQELVATVLKQNPKANIIYDACFQLDSSDQGLEYPYVLVQPVPYDAHRQINEDEFPRFVQKMTGLGIGKLLDENVSSVGRQRVLNWDIERPQLDVAQRRYLQPINADVHTFGPVRGLIVGYFGRDSLVQVAFYSRRSDWDHYADVRRAILESFRFAPDSPDFPNEVFVMA